MAKRRRKGGGTAGHVHAMEKGPEAEQEARVGLVEQEPRAGPAEQEARAEPAEQEAKAGSAEQGV